MVALLLTMLMGCGGGGPGPDEQCQTAAATQCAPGDKVRLTVVVNGGDEVQFYDNQNVLHRCWDVAEAVPASKCTADLVRGSEVRIQRTLGSITRPRLDDEEGGWRLYLWGGDCLGLDANIEPRGGICTVTMDSDKNVIVGFEKRAKLWVQQVLYDQPMSVRWSLAFSPQKAGGNPTTRGGTFDCNSPSGFPVCEIKDAYYDVGTVITLTAGSPAASEPPAFWRTWGVGCAHAGQGRVCTVTLTGDLIVTGAWGFD